MILEKNTNQECIDSQVRNIIKVSNGVWRQDNIEYNISIDMGVARFPYDGQSFTDVFRNVDIALNFAKKKSKRKCLSI